MTPGTDRYVRGRMNGQLLGLLAFTIVAGAAFRTLGIHFFGSLLLAAGVAVTA